MLAFLTRVVFVSRYNVVQETGALTGEWRVMQAGLRICLSLGNYKRT